MVMDSGAARGLGDDPRPPGGQPAQPAREGLASSPSACGSRASASRCAGRSWRTTRAARSSGRGGGPWRPTRRVEYGFEPDGDGTRFSYLNQYDLPGGPARPLRGANGVASDHSRGGRFAAEAQGACGVKLYSLLFLLMADFLDEKRKEIDSRLRELRPLVDEYNRLEKAAAALAGVGGTTANGATAAPAPAARLGLGSGPQGPSRPPARQRRARRSRRSSWCGRSPASRSPSWPTRWASRRITCTACCRTWHPTAQVKRRGKGWHPA